MCGGQQAIVGDLVWSFVYGADGELYSARGYLMTVEAVGVVRRLSLEEFAATLSTPHDESVPFEPSLTIVRDGPDRYLLPAYQVTLSHGVAVTEPAYDPTSGPQPLPDLAGSVPDDG